MVKAICLLMLIIGLCSCSARTEQPTVVKNSYDVVERKKLNDALILSIRTEAMDRRMDISKEVVEQEHGIYPMVRVFFYTASQQIGQDTATHRIEWTKNDGFKETY